MLVLGELGLAEGLPEAVANQFDGDSAMPAAGVAIATYKGSGKKFFQQIAEQLDIPTEVESEDGKIKNLTLDQLKEEIAVNCNPDTLLIFPEAKRLTTGIRYWLEDLMNNGVRVCAFAVVNPKRDIFLEMLEVEIELPSDRVVREAMQDEAARLNLNISPSRLAALQPLAGRSPKLARQTIRREALGMNPDKITQHSQYLDITPIMMAALALLGVLKFWGMASGDGYARRRHRTLYIIGGCAIMIGLCFRYLGKVSGSKKKLGE
ncbi:MAG: hypothetical protein KA716_32110 [Gloeotrichia echinulata DEX184]|nr:hypothetical protein [Gloeotrichia echinulata DEX184]